jgi:hypothetical protein
LLAGGRAPGGLGAEPRRYVVADPRATGRGEAEEVVFDLMVDLLGRCGPSPEHRRVAPAR